MDWTAIGLAATAILGPFLTKGGEAIAEKIGADLYGWLKQRFEKEQDDDAKAALKETLEEMALDIGAEAWKYAQHAGRKTVKAVDIKLASK